MKKSQSSLKKLIKRLGIILGVLLLLFIGSQVIIYFYFQKNKTKIEAKISAILEQEINGNIDFENLDIVLYKSFPDATIRLKNLKISDSLYSKHNINAVEVEYLFLKVNMLSLLTGATKIKQAVLANGKIHLFVNADQYSNTNIFRTDKKKKETDIQIKKFELNNIQCIFSDAVKNKRHDVLFRSLAGSMTGNDNETKLTTNIDALVNNLGFNLDKGSFLEGDNIKGNVELIINKEKKKLSIKKTPVMVNDEKIWVWGNFEKLPDNMAFKLTFKAPNANFSNVRSSLTSFLQQKLQLVEIEKDIDMVAYLEGKLAFPDTPTVRIICTAKDNTFTTDFGKFTNANLDFEYYNNVKKGHGHSDSNSFVSITNFNGEFEGIPFQSIKFRLDNLITPYANANITANFDATKLKPLTSGTYDFTNGKVLVDIKYNGPLKEDDNRRRSLNGKVILQNADLKYRPRNLDFNNCQATLIFDNDDLYFKDIVVNRLQDKIKMSGEAKQFLNFYFKDPTKVALNFKVLAERFTVENYLGFFNNSTKKNSTPKNIESKLTKVNQNLATFTAASSMHLTLDLKNISYKSFASSRGRADISLLPNSIDIKKADVQFRTGSISAFGKIETSKSNKNFNVNANLKNIDIPQLLVAFDNFGQPTLNSKNILGNVNLNTSLKGILNSEAALISKSLEGNLSFKVSRGYLKDFEPLEKLERYALNTRDLSNLEIRKLDGEFKIKDGMIYIPPTQINTSAITVFMQGIYGIKEGTLLSMMIPIRNPKKDELKKAEGVEVDKTRGIKLYLEARDGADGKANISWQKKADRPSYSQ